MISNFVKFFEAFFLKGWWVALFSLLCYVLHEQGIKHLNQEFIKLDHQLQELEKTKETAMILHENLLLQVNSQSDPAWVEVVLMKGLGLVPEGQTKVLFRD